MGGLHACVYFVLEEGYKISSGSTRQSPVGINCDFSNIRIRYTYKQFATFNDKNRFFYDKSRIMFYVSIFRAQVAKIRVMLAQSQNEETALNTLVLISRIGYMSYMRFYRCSKGSSIPHYT